MYVGPWWWQRDAKVGPPPEPTIQQEEFSSSDLMELMQSLEQPLMEEQTQMIRDLFYNQMCMLEYQGHMSMILTDITAESLDPVSFMTVLRASVKPPHHMTMPEDLIPKLQPTPKPPKKSRNDKIIEKISPNLEGLLHWDDESATLMSQLPLPCILSNIPSLGLATSNPWLSISGWNWPH